MLVEIDMDNMGNVILTPRSKKIRAQMRRHNKEWTGYADDTVFLQEGGPVSEFLDQLSPSDVSEIESGWTVTKRMDAWEFGVYVGYDFQEVINP